MPDDGARHGAAEAVRAASGASGLKRDCLSYVEVLAQSVSVIAPSTVPAAILGLIFATAGNGTWLAFLLGMVGLVLVSLNVNEFARRSASSGSLYTYIVQGLGPTAGVMSGWALSFAYMLTGMSTLCGFGIFAEQMLGQIGIHLSILAIFAAAAIAAAMIASRDVQLSAKLMLACEGAALAAVLVLGMLIWRHQGFVVDTAQWRLTGVKPGGVLVGIVLVVFGFSGFESSTALGDEAKNPLSTIPRSVMQSVVISGLIFIIMAYTVVLGYKGTAADLGTAEAPLNHLASAMGFGVLGVLINIGILLSFFSCTLASISSTARIIYSMARHGLIFDRLGASHQANKTPYIAVGFAGLITFLLPAGCYLAGCTAFDAQGYFGTLCSFGFIVVYVLISIAAPLYLRGIGKLTARSVIFAVAAVGFMALPFLGTVGIPGSTLFPPPRYPNNILPYIFMAYMAVGLAWLWIKRARHPKMIAKMTRAIDENEVRFARRRPVS